MPEKPSIQTNFPPVTKALVQKLWNAIPESEREPLKETFKGLPLDRNPLNTVMDLALIHFKSTFGKPRKVAIIGPANVGKSTLFNRLIRSRKDQAEVSPVPGTTRVNQQADAGIFSVIDTPGADAVGPTGEQEQSLAMDAARSADFLILMFDATQGVKQTELELYRDILATSKPYIIVLNKVDLVRQYKADVIRQCAKNLLVEEAEVIPISALKGEGLSSIVMSIIAADPSMTISMAAALPEYRGKLAWRSVITSSSLSAALALAPLPGIDFIPLVINQTAMVMTIARIYQYKITPERAKELIATYGTGLLGKMLFTELSKFAGIPGWLLSAAVAASITAAMGYASIEWFTKGEKVTREKMQEISQKLAGVILARLKTTFKRKPSKKALEFELQKLLEEEISNSSLKIEVQPAEDLTETSGWT
ncbi:MAG TPA: Era-like GTP-binding protein [Anaerolineaceae bacterium]|nr:Era-like GTP-binding protein [Anaerolineaceae bacterium]